MTRPLFDASLLPVRQTRAEKLGGNYFLHERAFDECLDRIATVKRSFASAWILGSARPGWRERLVSSGIAQVTSVGPGDDLPGHVPELCLSAGALDTSDDLPAVLTALRHLIAPGGLFVGAFAGGMSLPTLRSAMAAADRIDRVARPHFHPLIDPASFGSLLAGAGFSDAVVDVDRVKLSYESMSSLVRDLRGMAATNRLLARSRRPLSLAAAAAAKASFAAAGERGRTRESIDIIHFAAWAPNASVRQDG